MQLLDQKETHEYNEIKEENIKQSQRKLSINLNLVHNAKKQPKVRSARRLNLDGVVIQQINLLDQKKSHQTNTENILIEKSDNNFKSSKKLCLTERYQNQSNCTENDFAGYSTQRKLQKNQEFIQKFDMIDEKNLNKQTFSKKNRNKLRKKILDSQASKDQETSFKKCQTETNIQSSNQDQKINQFIYDFSKRISLKSLIDSEQSIKDQDQKENYNNYQQKVSQKLEQSVSNIDSLMKMFDDIQEVKSSLIIEQSTLKNQENLQNQIKSIQQSLRQSQQQNFDKNWHNQANKLQASALRLKKNIDDQQTLIYELQEKNEELQYKLNQNKLDQKNQIQELQKKEQNNLQLTQNYIKKIQELEQTIKDLKQDSKSKQIFYEGLIQQTEEELKSNLLNHEEIFKKNDIIEHLHYQNLNIENQMKIQKMKLKTMTDIQKKQSEKIILLNKQKKEFEKKENEYREKIQQYEQKIQKEQYERSQQKQLFEQQCQEIKQNYKNLIDEIKYEFEKSLEENEQEFDILIEERQNEQKERQKLLQMLQSLNKQQKKIEKNSINKDKTINQLQQQLQKYKKQDDQTKKSNLTS